MATFHCYKCATKPLLLPSFGGHCSAENNVWQFHSRKANNLWLQLAGTGELVNMPQTLPQTAVEAAAAAGGVWEGISSATLSFPAIGALGAAFLQLRPAPSKGDQNYALKSPIKSWKSLNLSKPRLLRLVAVALAAPWWIRILLLRLPLRRRDTKLTSSKLRITV